MRHMQVLLRKGCRHGCTYASHFGRWLHLPVQRARGIVHVTRLNSSEATIVREHAFNPGNPAVIDVKAHSRPPACTRWFVDDSTADPNPLSAHSNAQRLRASFWQEYNNHIVPLEITHHPKSDGIVASFERVQAPLKLLLSSLVPSAEKDASQHLVYLAQHDLRDLPEALRADLPTPNLVSQLGKGDLYGSSLWLGKSPTYTPLHRDPNPNLLMQLAGAKTIRLMHPEVGAAVFEHVQKVLEGEKYAPGAARRRYGSSASFRGEEMMRGPERTLLHDLVWPDASCANQNEMILQNTYETTIHAGQILFVPQGWWHSVKGIGHGVTASANWWFR